MKTLTMMACGVSIALLSATPAAASGRVMQADKGEAVYTKLTAAEIREWIEKPVEMTKKHNATRKPAMRAYPNLPKEDLDALVTFLAAKKKK